MHDRIILSSLTTLLEKKDKPNFLLAEKYVREVVNEGGSEDEIVDSDGEVLGFETLVFAIFEFVHVLVETKKFRGAVKSGLSDLMYYIVLYMQITGKSTTSLLP